MSANPNTANVNANVITVCAANGSKNNLKKLTGWDLMTVAINAKENECSECEKYEEYEDYENYK